MTTANMNPKNLMIIAALGIGAYFLTTRRAKAAGVSGKAPMVWAQNPTKAIQPSGGNGGGSANILTGLLNAANILMGGGTASGTKVIANNDVPGQPGYGWQYYSDGTSIGPDGTYYKNGAALWSPSDDGAAVNNPDAYASTTVSGYPTSYQSY